MMFKKMALAGLLVFFTFTPAVAAEIPGAEIPRDVMNDIRMDQFPDFQKKWQQVTVRFRKDTNEMRLTFANDIAWKALLENSTDYPDGAVFAKIGLMTEEDPAFASSAVPKGAKRYQFMVRDKKKYADTHGWGYALFNWQGKNVATPETDTEKAAACNACHEMVPERGYVFSQKIELDPGVIVEKSVPIRGRVFQIVYDTVGTAELPEKLKKAVPEAYKTVRMMTGVFTFTLFQGTIDEMRPELIREALASKSAAALLSVDREQFSLVFPDPEKKDCPTPSNKKGVFMKGFYTKFMGEIIAGEKFPVLPFQACVEAPR